MIIAIYIFNYAPSEPVNKDSRGLHDEAYAFYWNFQFGEATLKLEQTFQKKNPDV